VVAIDDADEDEPLPCEPLMFHGTRDILVMTSAPVRVSLTLAAGVLLVACGASVVSSVDVARQACASFGQRSTSVATSAVDTSAATLLAAAQKAQPDVEHAADLAANAAAKNSDWDTLSREESYMVHAGQVMGLI
jgi:hypothetical protein